MEVRWLLGGRGGGLPEGVVGDGGGDVDEGLGNGVDELDTTGVEADAAIGVATVEAILEVTLDGTADLGKLTADLMMTACLQVHLHQMIVGEAAEQTVVEDGLLAAGTLTVVGIRLVLLFVADEPVLEGALLLRRTVLDDGPVGLVDLSVAEHLVEPLQGLAGLGEHHDAAGGTIETMHDADEGVARLVILLFQVGGNGGTQGLIAGLVALHNLANSLVDDDDMVVFVEDGHGW